MLEAPPIKSSDPVGFPSSFTNLFHLVKEIFSLPSVALIIKETKSWLYANCLFLCCQRIVLLPSDMGIWSLQMILYIFPGDFQAP